MACSKSSSAKSYSLICAYNSALKAFPDHPWAQIELGVLEFEAYRQAEKANNLILKALQSKGKLPTEVKAEGYFVLAQIVNL